MANQFNIYPAKKPFDRQIVIIAYDGEYVMPAQYIGDSDKPGFKPYYTDGIVIQGELYWMPMPEYPKQKIKH